MCRKPSTWRTSWAARDVVLLGYTAPVEMPNKFGMAVRDPAGVVGLITPWNFPIAVPPGRFFQPWLPGTPSSGSHRRRRPPSLPRLSRVFEEAGCLQVYLIFCWPPVRKLQKRSSIIPGVRVLSFTGSTLTGAHCRISWRGSIKSYRSRWAARMPSLFWMMPTLNWSRMRHSGPRLEQWSAMYGRQPVDRSKRDREQSQRIAGRTDKKSTPRRWAGSKCGRRPGDQQSCVEPNP